MPPLQAGLCLLAGRSFPIVDRRRMVETVWYPFQKVLRLVGPG